MTHYEKWKASHSRLLNAARLQMKYEPTNTVRALEDAVKSALTEPAPAMAERGKKADEELKAWKTAAHLLVDCIQKPNDKSAALRAAIAYYKIGGIVTPPKP